MELDDGRRGRGRLGTVADLVDAIHATETGPDADGRAALLHHDQPDWWVRRTHLRRHGGGPGPERGAPDVAAGLEVHSLHGYFLRPTASGRSTIHAGGAPSATDARSRTRAVVERGRGQGDLPHDLLVPRARGRATSTSCRWPGHPAARRTIEGFEAPFPFDVRELGHDRAAVGRHLPLDPALLVPDPRAAARRPGGARLRPGLLLGHDRGGVPSAQPRRRGEPTPTPASTTPCGSTAPGGPTPGASSTSTRW